MSISLESDRSAVSGSWVSRGDLNAFFGLMLDNIGDMILMAGLLVSAFGLPADFVLTQMIPGTAMGVLVGDVLFTFMAVRLARRSGRSDVTAMPLGLDTPSTFGSTLFIIGPAFLGYRDRGLDPLTAARYAWYVGIAMILASGIFKLACSGVSHWVRRVIPRAGLLGSLTAIALVLISFLPLLDIAAQPVSGFVALAVILATLTARWKLPRNFPGALAALLLGSIVYYGMAMAGLGPGLGAESEQPEALLRVGLPLPFGDWMAWMAEHWRDAVGFLPVAIPLALATVVGGIDCTESASATGDDYPTGRIIAADGIATLVGGFFGGVIQSTPYIGHPAYKAMGARAGYTLATAVFVGSAGVLGYFGWIFFLVPKAVIFPILIFVGLEITAQSFHATPIRHFPAVAFGCVPALAYLSLIAVNQVLPLVDQPFDRLPERVQHWIQTVTMLSGGFIVTSLLWATFLARLIDGRILEAARVTGIAALLSLFGIIHSSLPSSPILSPAMAVARMEQEGRYSAARNQTPYHLAAAYGLVSLGLLALNRYGHAPEDTPTELKPTD